MRYRIIVELSDDGTNAEVIVMHLEEAIEAMARLVYLPVRVSREVLTES